MTPAGKTRLAASESKAAMRSERNCWLFPAKLFSRTEPGNSPNVLFYRQSCRLFQWEYKMLKGLFGSLAVVALLAIAPASAQTGMMDCTDANMTKANSDMDKMPAGETKTKAMKEMSMAKDMMGKKDMAGCKTHMNNAMQMGMSK